MDSSLPAKLNNQPIKTLIYIPTASRLSQMLINSKPELGEMQTSTIRWLSNLNIRAKVHHVIEA